MIRVNGFFDIETQNWDTFVMGGIVNDKGDYRHFGWEEESDFFWSLVNNGGTIWAHNGGMYDFLWLLDVASREQVKCTVSMAGTRITRLLCKGTTFRDSYALAPFSLLKLCDIIDDGIKQELWGGRPHKQTGLPCICEKDCGGYCAITRDMSPDAEDALSWYLEKDCRAGLAIMQRLVDEAEASGYTLTGTVGGSSYRSAADHCELEPCYWRTTQQYKVARSAYYGGRTEVFRPECAHGWRYDIHSAYPAALSQLELPVGPYVVLPRSRAVKAYYNDKEGIYAATVQVPREQHIPPLPYRLPDGRVSFPIGKMQGYWAGNELRHAQDTGVDVDIRGGLVWSDKECVFGDWMQHIWSRRESALALSTTLSKWHKWFANSLTGKFAQQPDGFRIICCPEEDEIKLCGGADGPGGRECWGDCSPTHCCKHQCSGRCGAWELLDKRGKFFQSKYWRIPDCGHVHWAAYLTAYTRIQLHRMLEGGDNGESAVYCDTDSTYSTRPRREGLGDNLGDWGLEGEMFSFVGVAPKTYRYDDINGKEIIRAKGLSSITSEDFKRFVEGGIVTRTAGVKGLRSALRACGPVFSRKKIERSNKQDGIHYGSRIRDGDKTYPRTVKELLAWLKD